MIAIVGSSKARVHDAEFPAKSAVFPKSNDYLEVFEDLESTQITIFPKNAPIPLARTSE